MSTSTKKFSIPMQEGLDVANDITPSVLALARSCGVTADKFAVAIHEADENSLYRNEVAMKLQSLFVKSAVEEAKKKEKEAKDND